MSSDIFRHEPIASPARSDRAWSAQTWDRWAWSVPALLALVGFAYTATVLPRGRENATLAQFVLKIALLVVAIIAVALFPTFRRAGVLVASSGFVIFLGYIIPKLTYSYIKQDFDLYYFMLWSFAYPALIIVTTLTWKQAGGTPGQAVKAGLNGLVLVSSGFLEWMWFRVNTDMNYYDMKTIPHIDVLLGHFPSYGGLFVFMLCHIPLVVLINVAPFDRWLAAVRGTSAVTSWKRGI